MMSVELDRLRRDAIDARASQPATAEVDDEVARRAEAVLREIAGERGRVVCKHPHLKPPAQEFRAALPGNRAVWLIRNPLTRLNSLYARGWTDHLRPNYELEHYKAFARNWLAQRPWRRLTFEQMRSDPRRFYRRMLLGWGVRSRVIRASSR